MSIRRSLLGFSLALAFAPRLLAQVGFPLFSTDFPPEEFAKRRAAVYDAIGGNAIAILQGALITLLAYSEGLHAEGIHRRDQARILGKSVLWATAILLFAYGLQCASWKVSALLSITGLMHFCTLWLWRWRRAERDRQQAGARNVLIVGAGPVGQSVSAWVEPSMCDWKVTPSSSIWLIAASENT